MIQQLDAPLPRPQMDRGVLHKEIEIKQLVLAPKAVEADYAKSSWEQVLQKTKVSEKNRSKLAKGLKGFKVFSRKNRVYVQVKTWEDADRILGLNWLPKNTRLIT